MKNFIKGFRFTPSNYPAEVEAKIQKYRKVTVPSLPHSTTKVFPKVFAPASTM